MESTILLGVIIMTLAFIILGLTTQYKVMLIVAVGGVITIMVELIAYPALVVVFIGLIIFLLWYATLGSRY